MEHEYSDTNRSLLKGLDREKISLLQSAKDENGNDLFFFALGFGKRKETQYGQDEMETEENIKITTYLPHSFLYEPPPLVNFRLTDEQVLFDEPYKTKCEPYQGNCPAYAQSTNTKKVLLYFGSLIIIFLLFLNIMISRMIYVN